MRLAILTSSLVLLSTVAQAGSIEAVTTRGKTSPSQMTVTCNGCTPLPKSKYEVDLDKVKWKPSDADVEIKEVNGVKKRFVKEAWFGGSPVTFVSKELGQDILDTAAAQPMPGVDAASTTAALTQIEDVDAVKAGVDAGNATTANAAAETIEMAPENGASAKPIIPRKKIVPAETDMDAMAKTGTDAPQAGTDEDMDSMKMRVN